MTQQGCREPTPFDEQNPTPTNSRGPLANVLLAREGARCCASALQQHRYPIPYLATLHERAAPLAIAFAAVQQAQRLLVVYRAPAYYSGVASHFNEVELHQPCGKSASAGMANGRAGGGCLLHNATQYLNYVDTTLFRGARDCGCVVAVSASVLMLPCHAPCT